MATGVVGLSSNYAMMWTWEFSAILGEGVCLLTECQLGT